MRKNRKDKNFSKKKEKEEHMNKAKLYWLEIIFGALIGIVILLSITNSVKYVQIDYGKHLQSSNIEIGNLGMDEYLRKVEELKDCTAIIVVKDIQGYCTTTETIDEMKNMGFDQADVLLNKEYHSFIGIWYDGQVVHQQIGGDEAISFGQYMEAGHYVFAKSATWSSGNTGDIYIDDVQYSVNGRGYNIVILDNEWNLIDSVSYDVYVEDIPLYRKVDGAVMLISSTIEKE